MATDRDTHKQLQDLLRTAEAFRRAMIVSGAVNHVGQSTYMDQLRALESALQPLNYRVPDEPQPGASLVDCITRAITTATNDDSSEVGSVKRQRHVERIETMHDARDAAECWSIVEQLRASEGACVSLFCDNPEFGGPNNAIEVTDDWTGWEPRRFEGDSILDALRGAKATHDAHVEIEKVRNGR